VSKPVRGTSAEAGTSSVESVPLPDLTGVDLHDLRVADDPVVRAAVDDVLRRPERFTGTWWGADGPESGCAPVRHRVPTARGLRRRTA
jgi:hypothetical protein